MWPAWCASSWDCALQATLAWLGTFDMDARLLAQLTAIKGRVTEAVGFTLFSGESSAG